MRILYIDPQHRHRPLIEALHTHDLTCVSLDQQPKKMLEEMLDGENILFVACDEMVRSPMVAAASSWMTVVAFTEPLVANTNWKVMPINASVGTQAEFLKQLVLRGGDERRRTRIPLVCGLWIKGNRHDVTNASLRELWLPKWAPGDGRTGFDGILELPEERGRFSVRVEVIAQREEGCACHITPFQDVNLLTWVDYFLEVLHQTPETERIEPMKEFFA